MSGHWIVMCQVSGGVTGFHRSPLKRSGEVERFETEDAAREVAQRLTFSANGPFRTCEFAYWPELVDEGAPGANGGAR